MTGNGGVHCALAAGTDVLEVWLLLIVVEHYDASFMKHSWRAGIGHNLALCSLLGYDCSPLAKIVRMACVVSCMHSWASKWLRLAAALRVPACRLCPVLMLNGGKGSLRQTSD
jgi:hypothetical protein